MGKIVHVSDLHLDVNESVLNFKNGELAETFKGWLEKKEVDVLMISGDIYNNMGRSLGFIDDVEKEIGVKVLFVPGNHDLWVGIGRSSEDSLEEYLSHSSNVISEGYELSEGIVIQGALGWYDYSYRLPEVDREFVKYSKRNYWADSKYLRWERDDVSLFEDELEKLERSLEKLRSKEVWVMTHFVPYQEYIVYKDWVWNLCNSFIGSKGVGDLLNKYDNVKKVFFGHTHTIFEDQRIEGKEVVCSPLGYVGEWGSGSFIDQLEKSSVVLYY